MMPVLCAVAVIMMFALICSMLGEKYMKMFHIGMIILSILLMGYVCYCKWSQASEYLDQTQEVQP